MSSAWATMSGARKNGEYCPPGDQAEALGEKGKVDGAHNPRKGIQRTCLWRAEKRKSRPPERTMARPQPMLPSGLPRRLSATAREARASTQNGRPRISSEERTHIQAA